MVSYSKTCWAASGTVSATGYTAVNPANQLATNCIMVQNTGSGELHVALDPVDPANVADVHIVIKAGDVVPRVYLGRLCRVAYAKCPSGSTGYIIEGWMSSLRT
jgi:hypothetical protein